METAKEIGKKAPWNNDNKLSQKINLINQSKDMNQGQKECD